MKYRLTIIALICATTNLAFAQSPGIVYPTSQADANQSKQSPSSKSVSSSPIAQGVAIAAKAMAPASSPSVDAGRSSTEPTNPPAKFVDPRRIDLQKAVADATKAQSDSKPKTIVDRKVANKASGDDVIPEVANPDGSKVQVTKKADGSKVIRAQVPGSVAQAEALVNSQIPVPAYSPNASSQALQPPAVQVPAPVNAVAKALDSSVLPKWVTSGVERTSARNQIVVVPGVTEIVRIARNFPNRFQTPFDNAEVITTDENLTHDGTGGAVIVATASDKPIGIFIQDTNSERAIALVLIPEDIPQRDVKLILDDSWGPPQLKNLPDQNGSMPSAQTDYIEFMKGLMRALAKSEVPDGHALSPLQPEFAPNCQSPGLQMRLGQMMEGAKTRIAVYTAKNQTQSTVPFQESGCYRTGVLAVSAFPRPVLQPGQDTEVYVIVRKDAFHETSTAKRRPALVSQ